MKNLDKNLEELKLYSVEELMNAYTILQSIPQLSTELEIDFDEAFEDLRNELKTRPIDDLIDWIIDEKKL